MRSDPGSASARGGPLGGGHGGGLCATWVAVVGLVYVGSMTALHLVNAGGWSGTMGWREAMLLGEKSNVLLAAGALWRLAASMLLHASAVHIGTALACILVVVPAVERAFGVSRPTTAAAAAGLAGTSASWAAGAGDSVGSSASILGVAAAGLVAAVGRGGLARGVGIELSVRCGLVLAALFVGGLLSGGVDHAAHVTGVVVGAAIGATWRRGAPARIWRVGGWFALLLVAVGVVGLVAEWVRCAGSPGAFAACYSGLW